MPIRLSLYVTRARGVASTGRKRRGEHLHADVSVTSMPIGRASGDRVLRTLRSALETSGRITPYCGRSRYMSATPSELGNYKIADTYGGSGRPYGLMPVRTSILIINAPWAVGQPRSATGALLDDMHRLACR